jgi:beta-N-acetylglucosaminidase
MAITTKVIQKTTGKPTQPAPVTPAPAATAPVQNGGLDYNKGTTAQKQAMQDNWSRLNSDSAYLGSEMERAQAIKKANPVGSQGYSDADAYITRLSGISAGGGPNQTAGQQGAATGNNSSPTTDYINQMRDLSVKNQQALAYDSRNQADAMNLQNAKGLQEVMANAGLGAAGENITATLGQNAQRSNSINSINNNLAQNINNLDINRAQQLQQQYNLDEDRALQLAQIMGTYKGNDTLAKQDMTFNQGVTEAGLTGNYKNQRTIQGRAADQDIKNANLDAALAVGNQTGYNVTPQEDYAGLFRQIATGTNSQGGKLTQTAAQTQQNIDNTYRDEQAKIQNAFQQQQLTLDQAQFALQKLAQAQDEAYRYAGLELDMMNSGSGGGSDYNGLTTNQVVDNIKSNYMIKNDDGDSVITKDSDARQHMFLDAYNAAPDGVDPKQIWTALGLTQDEIKQWQQKYPQTAGNFNSPSLNNLGGVLSNSGDSFTKYANKYGVDPTLLAAISMWETGNGTSSMAKNKNNIGGMYDSKNKTFYSYDSLDAGIEAMAKNLAKNYINQGLTSIPQIGKKYAPSGAANDPNGLNNHWVKGVTDMYNKLKGGS